MIDIPARAAAILDAVRTAVAASTVPDVDRITVADDGRRITVAESLGAGGIIVAPLPGIDWPAPHTIRLTWTYGVVALVQQAGAGQASVNAARVHALLGILDAAGMIQFGDKAEPTDFRTDTPDVTIPGYVITHTEEHYS